MSNFYAKSRVAGTCRCCRQQIEKGSPAWWSQTRGWECTSCKPAPANPAPSPQVLKRKPAPKSYGLPGARVERDGNRRIEIEFASLSDAVKAGAAIGTGAATNANYIDGRIKLNSGSEFLNYKTAGQLVALVEQGSPEMTRLVEDLRGRIASEVPVPTENRRKVRRGRETGDEIDGDRFLDRIPEMWNRIESHQIPARRVIVTINASVSGGQGQDELAYRSAAAIALGDRLTEMGASVEIRLCKSTTEGPVEGLKSLVATAIAKRSDQPMNIPEIAAGCCDIGAFRMGMVYGPTRYCEGRLTNGLGYPSKLPDDFLKGDFVIERDVTTLEAAIAWVNESISKFAEGMVANG